LFLIIKSFESIPIMNNPLKGIIWLTYNWLKLIDLMLNLIEIMAKLSHQSTNSIRPACNKCGYRKNWIIFNLISTNNLFQLIYFLLWILSNNLCQFWSSWRFISSFLCLYFLYLKNWTHLWTKIIINSFICHRMTAQERYY